MLKVVELLNFEKKENIMLYLASASPRRRDLLKLAGFQFAIEPADIDETMSQDDPACLVQNLALKKARAVAQLHPNDIVLAADTVVALDNRILGKPENEDEARTMLRMLSNRIHQVYTGYCILKQNRCEIGVCCTSVEFYPLSDSDIDSYIATGEPFDKAGAYGIQGLGSLLVRKIDGDFYNVVGLPIAEISRLLRTFGSSKSNEC